MSRFFPVGPLACAVGARIGGVLVGVILLAVFFALVLLVFTVISPPEPALGDAGGLLCRGPGRAMRMCLKLAAVSARAPWSGAGRPPLRSASLQTRHACLEDALHERLVRHARSAGLALHAT